MEWNYSECGGDSDVDEDSNQNPLSSSFNAETEVLQVLRQTLELPKGLCAQPEIFWEFFAPQNLWNELSREARDELMAKHLPTFPADCDDRLEKERTIQKLFNRDKFNFNSSPLVAFQQNLEEGNYLTDMVSYRAKIARSERHEQRFQECEYISRVASKLAASRKSFLDHAYNSSSAGIPQIGQQSTSRTRSTFSESVAARARKRYLNELASFMSEASLPLSDSEEEALLLCSHSGNYNNNIYKNNNSTNKVSRKPGRPSLSAASTGTSNTMDLLTDTGESKICGTFSYKPKSNSSAAVAGESSAKTQYNDEYVRQTLRRHKKRKTEDPDYRMARALPMYEYLMQDMFTSPASCTDAKSSAFKSMKSTNSRIKTESMKRDPAIGGGATEPCKMLASETTSKPRIESYRTIGQPVTKKLKISANVAEDTSARPPALNPTIPDVPERMVTETTLLPLAMRHQIHACFMSLVRSIFCSTPDHRTTFENLKQTVRAWLQSDKGSAAWFDDCHSWLDELPSVVKFLVGEFPEQPEDYVPYLEYKAPLRIYQWIGAGRDTDQHLLPLNRFWLEHRHEFGRASMPEGRKFVQPVRATTTIVPSPRIISLSSESIEDVFPPHRSPTTWLVRPERADEVATFRAQEKQRYENPSSPFTYRLHGYEVSVGPVAGVYAQVLNKGQNLLVAGRPHSVTIMSLVRDAISRLPNGEGTKAQVCELLKASQYLVPGSVTHGVVNTVTERLQKVAEGCVYFEPRRKVFVYTHRARTEADFRKQNLSTATFKKVVVGKSPVVREGATVTTAVVDQKVTTTPRVISRTSIGGSMVKMVVKGQPLNQGTTPVAMGSPTTGINPQQQQHSVFQIRTSKASPVMMTSTSSTTAMARPVSRGTAEQTKDIEANLDAKHPPALIPKLAYNKAPVKLVSGAGVQSFQISGNQNRPMMSLLTNAQGQSVLMHNQRTVQKTAGNQSVLISPSSNPPALVAASGVKSVAPRTSTMTVVPVTPKVVRPKVNASPVAAAVTVMPKKTISISPATIAAAVKGNALQKPIQICTSTGNVSPANGSVLRTAATSLLAGHKQMIQNIVIRSSSPQAQAMQGTRTVPLSGAQSAGVKSIIVTNAAGGGDGSAVTSSGQNIIKIRTSSANQQLRAQTANNTATVLPKTITTAGGAQFLQIHSTGSGGQPQQFILNSVRQANSNTQAGGVNLALKATPGKQVTSSPHLVQLPAKTLIKGSPVTARVLKTVGSTSQGSVMSPNQSIVRTVQSRVMSTTTTSPGQLVTLVDAAKGTHSTPIRIAKAGGGGVGGGTTNVIQLAATNGTGAGTQYTVLSQGQSPARTQILNAKMVTQAAADGSTVGVKTGIRMLNAASITRLGAGKPVLISNKLPGNVTNLVRAATATAGVKVTPATVTSSSSPNTPQTTNLMIGGQQVKGSINLSGSTNTVVARSLQGTTTQHVMIGNQLVKIQSAGTASAASGTERGKPVILNSLGQAYKVQSQGKLIKTTVPVGGLKSAATGTGPANRVVLVQGPQGQLILPSNLQGGFKSLKMISVQPQVQQQQKASQQPK